MAQKRKHTQTMAWLPSEPVICLKLREGEQPIENRVCRHEMVEKKEGEKKYSPVLFGINKINII